jgi:hypothetical protein
MGVLAGKCPLRPYDILESSGRSMAHCRRSVYRSYAQSETDFASAIGGLEGMPTQTALPIEFGLVLSAPTISDKLHCLAEYRMNPQKDEGRALRGLPFGASFSLLASRAQIPIV